MEGYQDRPSGRGDTGFVPEDRMTRTTVEDSQLWQLIRSIQEQEVAASVLQGLLWKGDVLLGSERTFKGTFVALCYYIPPSNILFFSFLLTNHSVFDPVVSCY